MLTDSKIKAAATPSDRPYKLYDRDGLFILVNTTGAKWWRFKYRINSKEKLLSLGVYPDVSLALARTKRDEARRLLATGVDPSQERRDKKQEASVAHEYLFKSVATEWLALRSKSVSTETLGNIERRLTEYVLPEIGSIPIFKIDAPMVLKVIRKVEQLAFYETARRVKQDIGKVLRYGAASGRRSTDSTGDLRGSTVPVRVTHRAAVTTAQELAPLLQDIWRYDGDFPIKCALKLLPMLLVRPSELAEAEWIEFDLDKALWLIPEARMKMQKALIVPLAAQAVEILKELYARKGASKYVLPNRRRSVAPMHRTSLSSALVRMGYKGEQTAHGFRATARTLIDEALLVRVEHIEMQLAHDVKDSNGTAYNRTAFLEDRKTMMQRWADYLDELRAITIAP